LEVCEKIVAISSDLKTVLVSRFQPYKPIFISRLLDMKSVEPMRFVTLPTPRLSAWFPAASAPSKIRAEDSLHWRD
jgi:hypothetical protein